MSLTITLRKCLSEYNRVTKEFTSGADLALTGTFKEEQNLLNPEIEVETSSNLSEYNYCEISEFGRKYFMSATVVQTGIWRLHLEVDVLSTYATGLANCPVMVKRTYKDGKNNYYMNDGVFFTEQREVITYHGFVKTDSQGNRVLATLGTPSFYLMVAGG